LEAKDPIRVNERGYLFPVSVVTELASKNQKVSLRADIETTLHRDFKEAHVHVRTRIRDLQVELPPLDPLRGRPRLKRDARILISKEKKKIPLRKFKATFSFEMETAAPGRIRLLSKHFNPALPLTLKLSQDSEKIRDGFIEAQPFEIVYLKRRIQVEKLRLFLDSDPQKAFKIDGRLKIPQTEYILFADLSGTVAKPIIDLSSDPYLPDSEIISVLLYDRTSDQLVAADAETAGSVRAAMVDRAIGLFGLWAFASTPIRNFSYNPSTKVYTATLALSDDTTAGIGTTWDQTTNLELRKRVSKRWVLTAEWVPTGEEEDLTRLVLQWEKRF
ncbi:MAG: translocation/assembly module TamB domain-containing protein, partial [Pseudobdellovibrionaceae bacterium]